MMIRIVKGYHDTRKYIYGFHICILHDSFDLVLLGGVWYHRKKHGKAFVPQTWSNSTETGRSSVTLSKPKLPWILAVLLVVGWLPCFYKQIRVLCLNQRASFSLENNVVISNGRDTSFF